MYINSPWLKLLNECRDPSEDWKGENTPWKSDLKRKCQWFTNKLKWGTHCSLG